MIDSEQIALMAKTIILSGHLLPRDGDPPDGRLIDVSGVERHLLFNFLRSSIDEKKESVLVVASYARQDTQVEQVVWMYYFTGRSGEVDNLVRNGFLKPDVRYFAVPRDTFR